MTYSISKARGFWRIARIENDKPNEIAKFKRKKEALLTARLLAGPCGHVIQF